MYNAIIVDDEVDAIEVLSVNLKEVFEEEIKIIGKSTTLTEAVLLIKEYKPDLIFLDIDLGNNESGFDVLRAIGDLAYPFKIIFTTAFHQFAIKAIRIDAYDYLLKPIGQDDLFALKERLLDNGKMEVQKQKDVIIINTNDATYKILLEEISYFKGEGNYTSIYLKDKKKPILDSNTLNSFEQKVNSISSSFFRIHKSYLVNLSEIEFVKKSGVTRSIIMKNGDTVLISRLRYKEFSKRYF